MVELALEKKFASQRIHPENNNSTFTLFALCFCAAMIDLPVIAG
jgi:hypothetical protein